VTTRPQGHSRRRTSAGHSLSACPDLPDLPDLPETPDGPPGPLPTPLTVAPAEPAGPTGLTGPDGAADGPRVGGWRAAVTRLGRDARALATPGGLRGAVVESVWVTTHVATYPWGLLRERPSVSDRYGYGDLSPLQRGLLVRDVEAAGTPILLLHGMIDNRAIFTRLTRRLRAHGYRRVHSLNYSPATNDIRVAAESLAREIESLVAQSGHERVHLVGHSLGGLIARYYVQRLGGDARVGTLVTLGTPHHGTLAAHLVPARLGRQLRPGSELFRELDLPAPGCATRIVAYWSNLDQLIVPHDNARLDHPDLRARNVLVHGVWHLSLPIDGRVVHAVAQVLAEAEDDTPPVTALPDDEAEEITPA
jgi:pimeloyl-ACP methyl ester carboxylesterase